MLSTRIRGERNRLPVYQARSASRLDKPADEKLGNPREYRGAAER